MPSGFQQDQNQLTPSFYRVVIAMSGNWYSVGNSAGPNTEGKVSTYSWDSFSGNNRPTTQAFATALARGNLRFQAIVEAVSGLADCQILDIESDAIADGNDMADNASIAFTVKYDRDEGVLPAYCAIRKAENASTNGDSTFDYNGQPFPQYLSYSGSGAAITNTPGAIKDVVWHAIQQTHTRSVRVFHPVEGTSPLLGEGFQEYITATQPFDSPTTAIGQITVQEIDGTTTTITTD